MVRKGDDRAKFEPIRFRLPFALEAPPCACRPVGPRHESAESRPPRPLNRSPVASQAGRGASLSRVWRRWKKLITTRFITLNPNATRNAGE